MLEHREELDLLRRGRTLTAIFTAGESRQALDLGVGLRVRHRQDVIDMGSAAGRPSLCPIGYDLGRILED